MKKAGSEIIPAFNSYVRHKFADFGGKLITLAKVVVTNEDRAVYEKEGGRFLEKAGAVVALGTVSSTTLF
jgi:hypothetical protein